MSIFFNFQWQFQLTCCIIAIGIIGFLHEIIIPKNRCKRYAYSDFSLWTFFTAPWYLQFIRCLLDFHPSNSLLVHYFGRYLTHSTTLEIPSPEGVVVDSFVSDISCFVLYLIKHNHSYVKTAYIESGPGGCRALCPRGERIYSPPRLQIRYRPMITPGGLEPRIFSLSGRCPGQLDYGAKSHSDRA